MAQMCCAPWYHLACLGRTLRLPHPRRRRPPPPLLPTPFRSLFKEMIVVNVNVAVAGGEKTVPRLHSPFTYSLVSVFHNVGFPPHTYSCPRLLLVINSFEEVVQ
uniref:Uncharacterized protein n=1 Tax=Trypanosoma vivax (strain Y486) TaxID=1055687 RepID=G0TXK9_TRYVY|nr:hypothetical protein TVY486_0700430 [Trypanosoma vivax Y486]